MPFPDAHLQEPQDGHQVTVGESREGASDVELEKPGLEVGWPNVIPS